MIAAASEANSAKARSAESAVAAIPDVEVEVWYGVAPKGMKTWPGDVTVDLPLSNHSVQDKDHAADISRSMQANDQLAQTEREHVAQVRTLIAEYNAAQALWMRQRDDVLTAGTQTRLADGGAVSRRADTVAGIAGCAPHGFLTASWRFIGRKRDGSGHGPPSIG